MTRNSAKLKFRVFIFRQGLLICFFVRNFAPYQFTYRAIALIVLIQLPFSLLSQMALLTLLDTLAAADNKTLFIFYSGILAANAFATLVLTLFTLHVMYFVKKLHSSKTVRTVVDRIDIADIADIADITQISTGNNNKQSVTSTSSKTLLKG